MRCFALLLLFCGALINAKDLQILQIVPFGDNNVRLTFDRKISPNDLKQKNLSNTQSVLDINAILTLKKKNYLFPDKTRIQIFQQNKKIVRVLIQTPKEKNYSLRFSNKNLYIEFDSSKSFAKFVQTKQRRVVLDPGHGGKDCGAIGVLKVCEKIVTLKVAKLLETELKKRGYIVYMTRDQDRYLGLQERTNFANNKRADLFISIHANSIPKTSNKETNGIETYFLSTARSERARRVAEKENKDSIEVMNFFSKQTFLNSINTHRLIASNKLAIDIQGGILKKLRANYSKIVDGGVREGPFWVLAGALMPSVLIEIGYMSHPQEGRRITHAEYQANLASGIADGVDGYFEKNP